MILRFSVANFLSIRDRQELSFVASSLQDDRNGLINCDAVPGGSVLPAIVIYGANASGKSNVVSAISYMRTAILYSQSKGEPDGGVPRTPFALDPSCKKNPTCIDVDFVVGGIRHHYGFEASDERFVAEWLFRYPSGRRQVLFEREGGRFKFGRTLKGQNRVISDLTRDNSLFLSAAFQNGHEHLSAVAKFFQSIETEMEISVGSAAAAIRLQGKDVDERIIQFLKSIGTGVVDYRHTEIDVDDTFRAFQNDLISAINKATQDTVDLQFPDKEVEIELAHQSKNGEPVFFGLNRESAGTRRLLLLLVGLFSTIDQGVLAIIDELDASLHTQACEALLALFSSRAANPKGAQLVATTHDTNLLRSPLLRRDQVWFTEKDETGATKLYPLTDIRTRKSDDIEKGYLQGRYGAVPLVGQLSELLNVD